MRVVLHASCSCQHPLHSQFLLLSLYTYSYSSTESISPPGDPTDDQLSDEPVFDPEAVYDDTPTEE